MKNKIFYNMRASFEQPVPGIHDFFFFFLPRILTVIHCIIANSLRILNMTYTLFHKRMCASPTIRISMRYVQR